MGVLAVEILAQETACGNTECCRLDEAAGIRLVGDDRNDLGGKTWLGRGFRQRQHVGAATRNEDDDPLLARRDLSRHRARVPL
ncbi:hypothetical protein D9M72_510710 [compost metagenome]